MRVSIKINEKQIQALDALSEKANRSRAEVIRDAVEEYLASHRPCRPVDAFGLWARGRIDGLVYQASIRDEW